MLYELLTDESSWRGCQNKMLTWPARLFSDRIVLGDVRHMLLESPAMQPVRDRFAALFGPGIIFGSWMLWPLRTLSWTALNSCMHLTMTCRMIHRIS